MPSNTAFLSEMPSSEVVRSTNSLSTGMDGYSRTSTNLGVSGVSPRLLMSNVEHLRAIGIDIDTTNPIFRVLQNLIVTNYSILMLSQAYRAVVRAHAAREAALAAAETAAIIGIPIIGWSQAWRIALALAGAAMVTGAFGVGEKFGSGEWSLPGTVDRNLDFESGNIGTAQARRQIEDNLRSANFEVM